MIDDPDVAHGCLGTLVIVFAVLFTIGLFCDRDDLKELDAWELYAVRVIRCQSSDLPQLQNEAQKLLEKYRK